MKTITRNYALLGYGMLIGVVFMAFMLFSFVNPTMAKQEWIQVHHESQGMKDSSWTQCMPDDSWNGHKNHDGDYIIGPCETPKEPTQSPTNVPPTPKPTSEPTEKPIVVSTEQPTEEPSQSVITQAPITTYTQPCNSCCCECCTQVEIQIIVDDASDLEWLPDALNLLEERGLLCLVQTPTP